MSEACSAFIPHLWKANLCRDCMRKNEDHSNSTVADHNETADVPLRQVNNDNVQDNEHGISVENLISSIQNSTETNLPPCRYGLHCYRTNSNHFEQYSHPPEHERRTCTPDSPNRTDSLNIADNERTSSKQTTAASGDASSAIARRCKDKSKKKEEELRFIDQLEAHIHTLTNDLKFKDQSIEQLQHDQSAMKSYNQALEQVIADESELRERRDLEEKQILSIPQATPSYWGSNAFVESYREIQISNESPEFRLINDLLNSTIARHGDLYGTIYGKDPTEFLVTEIKRIQNKRLWHEYCCKKETIINRNHNRLAQSGSSIYLEVRPLLTPLLDSHSNEYWLFHGCSHDTLHHLLHTGYDPRVSSLKGMFGGGFYLAENSSKSNQYIPCPECKQNAIPFGAGCTCPNQQDLIFSMILHRAVLGDVHVALNYDRTKYCKGLDKARYVRRPPTKTGCNEIYDSVMGESVVHGGDRLQHREFILYERGQAYPEYLISFRRSAQSIYPPTDSKRLLERCRNFLKNTFRLIPE